jgi:glycogen(starch) synthase
MRVLMTTDAVGGVWTFTRELATGLLQHGCAVALVSLGASPNAEQSEWVQQTHQQWSANFQCELTDIPLEWMDDNADAYRSAKELLERIAVDFSADVVHSNQFCFGALSCEVPIVITAHSDILSWADACRGARLESSRWLSQYLTLVRNGLSGAAAIVAPTSWMISALESHFDLPLNRAVIPNGRKIAGASFSSSPRLLQAVTAGRLWDEAKNVRLLGEIDSPIPLLVAGTDRNRTSTAPEARGQVLYLGAMEEHALHALFRESSIYLCPSKYEPFGLAALEAALCGCAVLANDIPSLQEVWGEGALYFQDKDSLGSLLDRVCGDPAYLEAARRRSIRRAATYSAGAMTERYLDLFRTVSARTEACHAA